MNIIKTVTFQVTEETMARLRRIHMTRVPKWAAWWPRPLQLLIFNQLGGAGAWLMTNTGRTSLLNGTFDIDSDTFKCALFLSTSNLAAASTTYAAVDHEHANANGYTTGGVAVTLTLAGTTTVTVTWSSAPSWTAAGGSIVAKFACIYEVGGNVLAYCLLDSGGADVTVTTGNILTINAHASGLFTLA